MLKVGMILWFLVGGYALFFENNLEAALSCFILATLLRLEIKLEKEER